MSNDDDYAPDEEARLRLVEEFQNNMRLSAERAEHDPWVIEFRRVKAKVEATGNESLYADYQRRFLAHLALLYPPGSYA